MQSKAGNGMEDKVDYVIIDSDDEYEMNDLPFKAKSKEWQNEYDAQNPIEELDFVDSSKWYSITVDDPGKHSKFDIFDGILQSISPFEFVPVLQESGTNLKKFYVTKCERAIKKISLMGFQFFCQNDTNIPFRLKVVHNDPPHQKINPFKLIHDVVKLRFNLGSNELNLANFKDSIDLSDTIYFPLWYEGNQKILKLLIKALLLGPYIHKLVLSDNSLKTITPLDLPNSFPNLTSLDLSNNLIDSFGTLRDLQGHMPKITDVWLDGNDLCCTFLQEHAYVERVKMLFPSIAVVDGRVFKEDYFPVNHRNFAIDESSVSLVNKFMQIYFTLFDSDERDLLTEMYTPKALFNIACQTTNVSNFHKRSRNLLHIKSKGTAGNVFAGPRAIIGCLGFLPKTEHDPLTFTVDITIHSYNFTVVTITGVFKMPSSVLSQDEPVFEFMRTFILVKVNDKYCYKIANDCLNISSHLSERATNAFASTVAVKDKLSLTNLNPSNLPRSVANGMTDLFIMLTQLPYSDARSYLERNRWNFRSALLDVINMLKKQ